MTRQALDVIGQVVRQEGEEVDLGNWSQRFLKNSIDWEEGRLDLSRNTRLIKGARGRVDLSLLLPDSERAWARVEESSHDSLYQEFVTGTFGQGHRVDPGVGRALERLELVGPPSPLLGARLAILTHRWLNCPEPSATRSVARLFPFLNPGLDRANLSNPTFETLFRPSRPGL